jgi:hypothetical protein
MPVTNVTPPSNGQNIAGFPTNVNYFGGKDKAGNPINYSERSRSFLASEPINEGQIVAFVPPDQNGVAAGLSTPLRVKVAVAADAGPALVGIATETVAAGQTVTIAEDLGYARCATGTAGQGAVLGAGGKLAAGAAYAPGTQTFFFLSNAIANYYGTDSAALVKFAKPGF